MSRSGGVTLWLHLLRETFVCLINYYTKKKWKSIKKLPKWHHPSLWDAAIRTLTCLAGLCVHWGCRYKSVGRLVAPRTSILSGDLYYLYTGAQCVCYVFAPCHRLLASSLLPLSLDRGKKKGKLLAAKSTRGRTTPKIISMGLDVR